MRIKLKTAKEFVDFCSQDFGDSNKYNQKVNELKEMLVGDDKLAKFSSIRNLSNEDFVFLVSSFVKAILKPPATIPIEGKIRVSGYTPIKPRFFKGAGSFSKIHKLPILIIGWCGESADFFSPVTSTRLAFVAFGVCSEFLGVGIEKIQNPIIPVYRDSIVGYDAAVRMIKEFQKNIKAKYKEKLNSVKHRKIKWTYHKLCENCQREFIAYRSDARSCHKVACKKALSRKSKVRQYKREPVIGIL